MKKIEYIAPEMVTIEMQSNMELLAGSPSDGGSSIPDLDDEFSDDDPS